jgi:hypothetical protein
MPFNQKLLPNKTRFNWRLVRRHKHAVSLMHAGNVFQHGGFGI